MMKCFYGLLRLVLLGLCGHGVSRGGDGRHAQDLDYWCGGGSLP